MNEQDSEQVKVEYITNLRPKDFNGYIQYRPDDGVVMIGRTGDSDWVELNSYVAGMFEWDLVEGGYSKMTDTQTQEATRIDFGMQINVRKMDKDEMPDDGITYYADDETGNIYKENELRF